MICENRRTSCSKLGMIHGGGKTLTGAIYHMEQQFDDVNLVFQWPCGNWPKRTVGDCFRKDC